jgi:hypothetical protein
MIFACGAKVDDLCGDEYFLKVYISCQQDLRFLQIG